MLILLNLYGIIDIMVIYAHKLHYITQKEEVIMASIPILSINTLVELKKPHPCGNKIFKVTRIGSDIKIICCECGHTLTLERIKFEKMIKKIVSSEENK